MKIYCHCVFFLSHWFTMNLNNDWYIWKNNFALQCAKDFIYGTDFFVYKKNKKFENDESINVFFFVVVVIGLIENWNNELNFKFLQSIEKFHLFSILFSCLLIIELIVKSLNKQHYLCKQHVSTVKHAFLYRPSRVKPSHTADHKWTLGCVGQSLFSWKIDFGICWWSWWNKITTTVVYELKCMEAFLHQILKKFVKWFNIVYHVHFSINWFARCFIAVEWLCHENILKFFF